MAKKIRVWDGTQWQDVAPSLPYTAIHSAQASMPLTGVDGQVWLDTDGALAGQDFVPLSGGTMTGNLNVPSINSGGIAGQNYFINSNFDIWQRGTSFTTDSSATWIYTADRWAAQNLYSGGGAVNVVSRESTEVPAGSKYSIKSVVGNASAPNTGRMNLLYTFENSDIIKFAGKVVTVSAQVKAIGSIDRYNLAAYYNTSGGIAHAGTTYIGGNASVVNTSSFTRITFTFTVPSAATLTSNGTLGILFLYYKNNGQAESVGDGAYLSQVKFEVGNQATPFVTSTPNQQTELAACQRYYYRLGGDQTYQLLSYGPAHSTTRAYIPIRFPVTMRTVPSSIDWSTLALQRDPSQSIYSVTSLANLNNNGSGRDVFGLDVTIGSASLSAGTAYILMTNGSTSAYLGFSAEL